MFTGLHYLSWRYWLRHRGAFLLASLGVTLGIAVFVAIQIANASVMGAFSASVNAVAGNANLQIRGGSGGVSDALFARIKNQNDPRILASAPVLRRTLFSPTLKTTVLISGIDVFSEIDFRESDLTAPSGENRAANNGENVGALQFLLDPRAIAISASLAQKYDLKTGSQLDFNIGSAKKSFVVTRILGGEAAARAFGGDVALLDIASAQENFGEIGRLSGIDFRVRDADLKAVQADLQKLAPPDAIVAPPAQRTEQVSGMLGAFRLNLTALSSIAAFVGAFLIYNALASAVVRRRAEAGILRAVGASKNQIRGLFLLEAAFIGVFGSICGVLLGILLAKWTLGAVATTVSQLYIAVKARELFIPIWLPPASILAGTILSVLAAIPAASEAASTTPRAALSGLSLHHALERLAPRLLLAGIGLLILTAILCLPVVSQISPLLGFGAAGATMGGFCLMVPFLLLKIAGTIRPFAEKIGGVEGALAADNLRRALNRSSLVISALLVSLALIIGMNLMVRSFRATVADWIDNTISADVFVATADGFSTERGPGLPPEVINWAKNLKSVRVVDTLRQAQVEIGGEIALVLANELPSFDSGDRVIRWIETQNGPQNAIRDYQNGRAILISERTSNLLKKSAGDKVQIPTPSGARDFLVAGVFYDYNPSAVLYLDSKTYRQLWRDDELDGMALYFDGTMSGETFKSALFQKFGAQYVLTVLPNAEIRRQVFDTFDQTFAVTYALQLIALVVAAIGVFDTLASLMLERTTELAGLRAMGASAAQIRKLARWEFAFLGFFSWILGSCAGIVLAAQMIWVINRQFFGWTIFPQWSPVVFGQALILGVGAALVAGVFPARQAARRDLATALQRE